MSQASFVSSVHALARDEWNALAGADFPFLRHEFLAALEDSASVGGSSGWAAHHLVLRAEARVLAVMPCYLKTHSYGEYVFDWGWAEAYQRNGLDYYPKLLSAVPFTPATGPRLLVAPGIHRKAWFPQSWTACARNWVGCAPRPGICCSPSRRSPTPSWHGDSSFAAACSSTGSITATAISRIFSHGWCRANARACAANAARSQSRASKSRRCAVARSNTALWDRFFLFYQMTYARRSGHGGYLSREFFHRLGATMPDRLLLVIARHGGEPVAGALNIIGHDTLYGRYWGCTEEFAHLHFETCYYQGIDFCIREGLHRFDAGAQGEHKLARGFVPVLTRSCHLIEHPGFRAAIHDFLERERAATDAYLHEAQLALPYRKQENSLSSIG